MRDSPPAHLLCPHLRREHGDDPGHLHIPGIKYLAPIIAFFEIVIWLPAMELVMQDLSSIANIMAFALGFATGKYVGLVIEERISIGMVILRIIPRRNPKSRSHRSLHRRTAAQ